MRSHVIPVAAPALSGNEKAYVMDCLESTWISSTGPYIERFEAAFAAFCQRRHALTCSNGTTALHLAMLALDLRPGDEVIVPTLTFVATANAVTYCGGRPVFVDVEPDTWTIDPALIEAKITPRTRGILPVHLFGHPADMDAINAIARRHGLFVVEDAAQAHGAEVKGRRAGALSDIATFSFYGNKIITTGEGGMVVTDDDALAARVRLLRSHGMDPDRRYWHPVVGYNFRMTNVAAAIGLAQLEKVDWQLARRSEVATRYRQRLSGVEGLLCQAERAWARHVWWMFSVLVDDARMNRDAVMAGLRQRRIETRPFVHPIHGLPPYRSLQADDTFPVADRVARLGINLPTWAGLSPDDVDDVCEALVDCLRREEAGR